MQIFIRIFVDILIGIPIQTFKENYTIIYKNVIYDDLDDS